MIRSIIFTLLLAPLSLCIAQTAQTIITNVNLFDGEKLTRNTNLIFQDGEITDITNSPKFSSGSIQIDGKGKTMIPPLINAHVHIWESENLKQALKHGIFAVLEMYTTDTMANYLRAFNDSLNYSKYYSSNAGVTVPGGHGTQFGIYVPTVNDSISAIQFVKDRIKNGADYIKIIKEPLRPTLNAPQTLEIIEETHRNNKLAVAHISWIEHAVELAEQDVDGFVHIWINKSATEEQLELLKNKNVFIVPTLAVLEQLTIILKDKDWVKNSLSFDNILEEVRKAYNKGIPILAGTDSPNFDLNYTTSMFDEMILLSKAGLSNEDVIKSATTNIYKSFGLKDFGVLEKGSNADFILVTGNPLDNIEDIKNDKIIFKKGVEIK